MTLYTDVDMEPIPIQCNTAIETFTIEPQLPEGMVMDPATGTISGHLTHYDNENIVYTVTATNTASGVAGSTTTTFTFRARSQAEMTTPGMIGCYWKTITECKVPDFDFYYKNPAQHCQTVGDINFSDNDVDNTWPGLDRRFVDYYSAYFYSYLNILIQGTYQFRLSSDDGGILYIDDLTTPLITRDGCRARDESAAEKMLTAGRHLLVIRYLEYNAWSSLYLKYGSTELGYNQAIISSSDLRVGGRGPTFISYNFVAGTVNTDMPVTRPELNSGTPTAWAITPELPSGILLDTETGYISGRPTATSSGYYTVTATGVNGAASAQVRIVVTSSPLSGLRATYYNIADTPEMCDYPMLAGNAIQLSAIDIVENIYHPETSSGTVWSGFPNDFSNYFYMEWEGYLKMDTIGNWRLRITCDDGCKLIGADEQTLINHWGCHYYRGMETTYPVSKSGFYYFRVEYQQAGDTKGMTFEWKTPGGVWEVVPADKIYYVPTGVLTYKYERAHYFRNSPIIENTPITFGISTISGYSSFPELPTGITLNAQNGRISGTPTNLQVMTYYTITAGSGANQETTVIAFDVTELAAPTGLQYMQNGEAVSAGTPVELIALRPISDFTIQNTASVTVSRYTVSPELPKGLTLDEATGKISGTPTHSKTSTVYSITASNAAGDFLILLSLSVSGCKGSGWTGEFLHVTLLSGNGLVSVVNSGGQVQTCSLNTMGSDGNAASVTCQTDLNAEGVNEATICMNPATAASLSVKITCNENAGCRWQMSRDDGNYYPYRYAYTDAGYAPYYDSTPYPTTLTTLNTLVLSTTSVTAYSGSRMPHVAVTPNGSYQSITIQPALGDVTIDPTYPILSGTVSGTGSQVFTVTATGSAGSAQATLSVNFGDCSIATGRRQVSIVVTTQAYGQEQSWRLLKNGEELFSSGSLQQYFIYTETFCLEPGSYVLELSDSYGDGWTENSNLVVYDSNFNALLTTTIPHISGSTAYKQQNTNFVLEAQFTATAWKYLINRRPDSRWNQIGGDISAFTDLTDGNLGSYSQNGIYFVHKFDLTDGEAYPILEFGVYYKDGAIVYLNGEEVYRRNMNAGSVNQNTAAAGSFDGYFMRVGTAPGYLLKTGENVLAIELHRVATTQEIVFSGYVSYTAGDCVTRSVGGTITESQFYDKVGETATEAWDSDPNTQWTENGLPAWTVYSFNFDHVEWVNRLSFGSSKDDANRDASQVSVFGGDDGITWTHLFSYQRREMFESRSQTKTFMMMDHMNSYSKFKIEIGDTKDSVARVSVSTISLDACRLVYCPKDGDYPGTASGETITIDCPEGYLGERYRTCSSDKLKPTWGDPDETECRYRYPSAKGTTYIDMVYVISPLSYIDFMGEPLNNLQLVVSTYLGISDKNVEVWKTKDVTNSFTSEELSETASKTAVWVHVEVPDEQAAEKNQMLMSSPSVVLEQMRIYVASLFTQNTKIVFYMAPEMSQYQDIGKVSGWVIFFMIVVVLIVVAVIAFYVWSRLKNKKMKNGARKLKAAGTSKKGKDTKSKSDSKKARV